METTLILCILLGVALAILANRYELARRVISRLTRERLMEFSFPPRVMLRCVAGEIPKGEQATMRFRLVFRLITTGSFCRRGKSFPLRVVAGKTTSGKIDNTLPPTSLPLEVTIYDRGFLILDAEPLAMRFLILFRNAFSPRDVDPEVHEMRREEDSQGRVSFSIYLLGSRSTLVVEDRQDGTVMRMHDAHGTFWQGRADDPQAMTAFATIVTDDHPRHCVAVHTS